MMSGFEFPALFCLLAVFFSASCFAFHEVHLDYKGNACVRRCSQEYRAGIYRYNFCYTATTWGYCSPLPGVTSYNKMCRDDHQCGQHDYTYYWCYTKDDSWDYCSPDPTVESAERFEDAEGFYCKDDCLKRGKSYYWCNNDNVQGWGYCSPKVNRASSGGTCKLDSKCDRHGNTFYHWCYTYEDSAWQYCGMQDTCAWSDLDGDARQLQLTSDGRRRLGKKPNPKAPAPVSEWNLVCSSEVANNQHQNIFAQTESTNQLMNYESLSNSEMKDLKELIDELFTGHLQTTMRSRMVVNDRWRLDIQSRLPNGYINIQVQRNGPRKPGTTSSVAQIFVHEDDINSDRFTVEVLREAIWRSVRGRTRVCLSQSTGRSPANCPMDA